MEKKIYKAAVIGCGRIGVLQEKDWDIKPATHAFAFLKNPRTKLVAVADSNIENLNKAKKMLPKGVKFFSDAEKLLREINPDIVSVAVPRGGHCALVELLTKYKAPAIICEKPMADTIEQAKKMIADCKKSKSLLLINHQRRFDPALSEIRDEIKKGTFGKIQKARCLYVNGMCNTGSHVIDYLRFCLGDIKSVSAVKNMQAETYDKKDYCVDASFKFKNGTDVVWQSLDRRAYCIWEAEFYGTKKAVKIRDLGQTVEIVGLRPSRRYVGFKELDHEKPEKLGNQNRSFFKAMAQHVVDCLDKKIKPASTGEDGLAALKVLAAIKKSAENKGKRVDI
ncbi:MAG: Gfo/Idh/MocA family oxidoreductase [Candidatus Pacebacteria bacterium]|nr:Gfo/Idh/MocA family oxidoreductase [Candidatus Paceibacterota bacterium]